MSVAAVPFPKNQPTGYQWANDEPQFDPKKHLALEIPDWKQYLTEFGYSDEEVAAKASPVAVSAPFQVLSAEGAEILLKTVRKLRQHSISCERIQNMVRGGCYRSKFLRDLCTDPSLTQLMCDIYETDVAPHTMPLHLGHLNFAPDDLALAVDKWHHDTLPLDIVMMVTDPTKIDGGQFEYFVGTKAEMELLAKEGKTPPLERVKSPPFFGPGYAIALHGNMVVHRGAKLNRPAERISLVNGYVATDVLVDDQHRHKDLRSVDDENALYAEWARHSAWRGRERLDHLLKTLEFTPDRQAVANQLKEAVKDINQTIADMSDDGDIDIHHYEKSGS